MIPPIPLPSFDNPDHVFLAVQTAVFILLLWAAMVDALTGLVPDGILVPAAFLALAGVRFAYDTSTLVEQGLYAGAGMMVIYVINRTYLIFFDRDAIGMGDAKWTGVALLIFEVPDVLWGWVFGAWLGLMWMAGGRLYATLTKSPSITYVHFAPFLAIGLLTSLAFS